MLDKLFQSVIEGAIDANSFFVCTGVSVLMGLLIAAVHTVKNRHSASMVTTLAVLPFIVQCVIMMVNGNIGAGIAVAGAFSLVRFRSAQGSAREIVSVFAAMAIGLACGMGFVFVSVFIAVIASAILLLYSFLGAGVGSNDAKLLKITVPDTTDFTTAFEQVFQKYLSSYELLKFKSTNLGSLFVVTYRIRTKRGINEKTFVDELRCLNGNLDIVCISRPEEQDIL